MEDENIKHHLAAMNNVWKRYDKLEQDGYSFYLSPMDRLNLQYSLNETYKTHWRWLGEHGITDQSLVYDSETKTFALPD